MKVYAIAAFAEDEEQAAKRRIFTDKRRASVAARAWVKAAIKAKLTHGSVYVSRQLYPSTVQGAVSLANNDNKLLRDTKLVLSIEFSGKLVKTERF